MPAKIPEGAFDGKRVVAVAAGGDHSAAITADAGKLCACVWQGD